MRKPYLVFFLIGLLLLGIFVGIQIHQTIQYQHRGYLSRDKVNYVEVPFPIKFVSPPVGYQYIVDKNTLVWVGQSNTSSDTYEFLELRFNPEFTEIAWMYIFPRTLTIPNSEGFKPQIQGVFRSPDNTYWFLVNKYLKINGTESVVATNIYQYDTYPDPVIPPLLSNISLDDAFAEEVSASLHRYSLMSVTNSFLNLYVKQDSDRSGLLVVDQTDHSSTFHPNLYTSDHPDVHFENGAAWLINPQNPEEQKPDEILSDYTKSEFQPNFMVAFDLNPKNDGTIGNIRGVIDIEIAKDRIWKFEGSEQVNHQVQIPHFPLIHGKYAITPVYQQGEGDVAIDLLGFSVFRIQSYYTKPSVYPVPLLSVLILITILYLNNQTKRRDRNNRDLYPKYVGISK